MKNLSAIKNFSDSALSASQNAIIHRIKEDFLLGLACPIIVGGKAMGIESEVYSVQMADNGYIYCEFDEPAMFASNENYLVQNIYRSRLSMNHFGDSEFQERLRDLFRNELDIDHPPQSELVKGYVVRPLLLDDSRRVFDFLRKEKSVIRDTGFEWIPKDEEDALLWLHRSAPLHTIALSADGDVVGICGIMPDLNGIPNVKSASLFYAVAPKSQGNGLAGAMVAEGLKMFQDVHPEYTHAVIHTESHNQASKSVARKLGFQRDESTDYRTTSHGKPCTVYGSSSSIDGAVGFYLVSKMKNSMEGRSKKTPSSEILDAGRLASPSTKGMRCFSAG